MNTVPKYNREYKGSLYTVGYSDGYNSNKCDPHWINIDTGEKVYISSEEEVAEYDQGYNDGKFHFNIDNKYNQ